MYWSKWYYSTKSRFSSVNGDIVKTSAGAVIFLFVK
jgi:hypothetical protein